MSDTPDLKRLIAQFQHRNESLHRHPNEGVTCDYCDLIGHYAVRVMANNPDAVLAALEAAGVLAKRYAVPNSRYADPNLDDVTEVWTRIDTLPPPIGEETEEGGSNGE